MVIKRDGSTTKFDVSKIATAIRNANRDVADSEAATDSEINTVVTRITVKSKEKDLSVEEIQDLVEDGLMTIGKKQLAKEYILYRYKRALARKSNSTDDQILRLLKNEDKELLEENSNKNVILASTERDYMAGVVSKDLSLRVVLPRDIVKAHEDGVIHFHDLDYFLQSIFNCCLINIKDMLENGTVMNGKMIESPKSFQVACTVMTQIIASVASCQYGGQSVNVKHLGRFLKLTYDKYLEQFKSAGSVEAARLAEFAMKDQLKSGVQTIQYQINTLMTTNGQSPFVTLFLELDPKDEFLDYTAMIIEEILKQRYEGIKNEFGVAVTPAFPKLVYVLDEFNSLKGGKYDYLTRLAVKCSAKRMYPDYVSAKKMRENYGAVFSPMGCRSFLSPWKDASGKEKWEGRFNQGVVSLNLPQIAICSGGNEEKFWELLEERLSIAYRALMCRHRALEGTVSDISPIHWQYGAIARLGKGEKIDELLHNGYSTLSLGYIGVYETCKLMTGESNSSEAGQAFSIRLLRRLRQACDSWKASTGLGFALYGTPAESLCYRFAEIDRKKFGEIPDVTDKGYYTNSYHIDVREKIDAFSKLNIESQFQDISRGGAISYVEVPNLVNNLEALEELVKFIYENVQYAEFNTRSDVCHVCGFEGEIGLNDNLEWECPQCHNKDHDKMTVVRRTCGYIGENFWNVGKTKEIGQRVLHL